MNKKDFEKRLREESAQINIEMSQQIQDTRIVTTTAENSIAKPVKASKTPLFPRLVAMLSCCVVLCVCLVVVLLNDTNNLGLTSYIMEINPSICITTDKNDNIINIFALNEDANAIVSSEELENVVGLDFDSCLDKVMKIIKDEGYFDDYQNTIKLYAINDNNKTRVKRLSHFEYVMQRNLDEFGVGHIPFEKFEMEMTDFKDKMGFEENFDNLDDMNDFFKQKPKQYAPQPTLDPSTQDNNSQDPQNTLPVEKLPMDSQSQGPSTQPQADVQSQQSETQSQEDAQQPESNTQAQESNTQPQDNSTQENPIQEDEVQENPSRGTDVIPNTEPSQG